MLITCGIQITRGRLDFLWWFTPSVSKNNLRVWYTKTIFNGFSNSKIQALSIPQLWRAMTVIWFSLSVHSIVMAQTRLEYFGAFIVYMSTFRNVNITFGCIQFVNNKSHLYICINIYGRTRCNVENIYSLNFSSNYLHGNSSCWYTEQIEKKEI